MLFLPMGENKPIRVQGAFISDEVERVVQFVTDQQEAHYEEKMMPTDEVETTGAPEQPQDELFEEAKALSLKCKQQVFPFSKEDFGSVTTEQHVHGFR